MFFGHWLSMNTYVLFIRNLFLFVILPASSARVVFLDFLVIYVISFLAISVNACLKIFLDGFSCFQQHKKTNINDTLDCQPEKLRRKNTTTIRLLKAAILPGRAGWRVHSVFIQEYLRRRKPYELVPLLAYTFLCFRVTTRLYIWGFILALFESD